MSNRSSGGTDIHTRSRSAAKSLENQTYLFPRIALWLFERKSLHRGNRDQYIEESVGVVIVGAGDVNG